MAKISNEKEREEILAGLREEINKLNTSISQTNVPQNDREGAGRRKSINRKNELGKLVSRIKGNVEISESELNELRNKYVKEVIEAAKLEKINKRIDEFDIDEERKSVLKDRFKAYVNRSDEEIEILIQDAYSFEIERKKVWQNIENLKIDDESIIGQFNSAKDTDELEIVSDYILEYKEFVSKREEVKQRIENLKIEDDTIKYLFKNANDIKELQAVEEAISEYLENSKNKLNDNVVKEEKTIELSEEEKSRILQTLEQRIEIVKNEVSLASKNKKVVEERSKIKQWEKLSTLRNQINNFENYKGTEAGKRILEEAREIVGKMEELNTPEEVVEEQESKNVDTKVAEKIVPEQSVAENVEVEDNIKEEVEGQEEAKSEQSSIESELSIQELEDKLKEERKKLKTLYDKLYSKKNKMKDAEGIRRAIKNTERSIGKLKKQLEQKDKVASGSTISDSNIQENLENFVDNFVSNSKENLKNEKNEFSIGDGVEIPYEEFTKNEKNEPENNDIDEEIPEIYYDINVGSYKMISKNGDEILDSTNVEEKAKNRKIRKDLKKKYQLNRKELKYVDVNVYRLLNGLSEEVADRYIDDVISNLSKGADINSSQLLNELPEEMIGQMNKPTEYSINYNLRENNNSSKTKLGFFDKWRAKKIAKNSEVIELATVYRDKDVQMLSGSSAVASLPSATNGQEKEVEKGEVSLSQEQIEFYEQLSTLTNESNYEINTEENVEEKTKEGPETR